MIKEGKQSSKSQGANWYGGFTVFFEPHPTVSRLRRFFSVIPNDLLEGQEERLAGINLPLKFRNRAEDCKNSQELKPF